MYEEYAYRREDKEDAEVGCRAGQRHYAVLALGEAVGEYVGRSGQADQEAQQARATIVIMRPAGQVRELGPGAVVLGDELVHQFMKYEAEGDSDRRDRKEREECG